MTGVVPTENVALVFPAATVTDAGTAAEALPLSNDTTVPPGPAGPVKVAVPVEDVPPRTEDGFRAIEASAAGVTVSVAVWELPLSDAVITAGVEAFTPTVETVNVAEVCPPGTVTKVGTVATATPLDSKTAVPPAAAGPLSVTVPVDADPP